jgi:uncharacterized membrane protein YhaH (DUF805 family)
MLSTIRNIFASINFFNLPPRLNRIQHFAAFQIYTLLLIISVVFLGEIDKHSQSYPNAPLSFILLLLFANIFMLKVKRLHDMNMSGWWLLICIIPGIGLIFGLAIFILSGIKGKNKFGEQPAKASKLEYAIAIGTLPMIIIISAFVGAGR